MKDEYFNSTHTNLIPRLVTRFPTEVISSLDKDREENNIVDESGERIPDPLVIMAHTRYDIVPEPISGDSGGYGYYVRPVELRARLTEWSALSLCQVKRKITIINETTLSTVTASKHLHQAYPWYDNCWAPEDYLDGHGWMPAIFSQKPTGSFSMDDIWPRAYQANVSAGAFCLRNATIEFDPSYLLSQAFRGIKATNAKGEDVAENSDGQVWYQRWGKPYVDDDEDISVRASRISQRTLHAIMTSLTAGLNNINYGATNDTVTGSYVLRETILVARWGWLTVLFSIEFMGMGYLFYIIFRPRTVAGVWKDSIFAASYHGLDEGARNTIGHVKNLRDMRKATEYMEVRLDHPKEDNRAVLVREF